jgi:H+/Cl- antiporter ClcA
MTGGAFGSLFAQLFHLSSAERKTLLVAGAAAGMSAIFASPVAATLLAVELLLFEWKPRSFIPVALAAATASVARVPLLGAGPVFPVPGHGCSPRDPPVGAVLGVAAGFGSGLLTALVYGCEDLYQKLPFHWMWWPALGGLCVGVGGLVDPRVLGVGYGTIHSLLSGDVAPGAAASLAVTKSLVWALALGSGTSGGVLAPLLMMGGALGALGSAVLPNGDPGLWASIGMAAVMGGTMRLPDGHVLRGRVDHDWNLCLAPVACVAAYAVTVLSCVARS